MDINALRGPISRMSEEQLRALNKIIVEQIKTHMAHKALKAMAAFRVGDLVEFTDRGGRQVRVRVEGLNSKTMSGVEVGSLRRWRVAPELCRLVGADKPEAGLGTTRPGVVNPAPSGALAGAGTW